MRLDSTCPSDDAMRVLRIMSGTEFKSSNQHYEVCRSLAGN